MAQSLFDDLKPKRCIQHQILSNAVSFTILVEPNLPSIYIVDYYYELLKLVIGNISSRKANLFCPFRWQNFLISIEQLRSPLLTTTNSNKAIMSNIL